MSTTQESINRRRALAQALQQQAFQPIDMPQTPGANAHITQGLAKLAQALVAGLGNRKADKLQAGLDKELLGQRVATAEGVVPRGTGEYQTMDAPIGDPVTMERLAGPQDQNSRAALVQALSSSDPLQQGLAQNRLQDMSVSRRQNTTQAQEMARMLTQQRYQTGERIAGQDFTAGQNALRATQNPPAVAPGSMVLNDGKWSQIGTPKPVDETPEEKFISLQLRDAAQKAGGSLSPQKESEIRKTARAEWSSAGRENDTKFDAVNLQIKELQIQLAEERLNALRNDGGLSPKQMGLALQMANSLKSHPAYTDMLDIHSGLQGVDAGLAQKNGFGDITAINAFQRMVDPGATVREGDVALLQSGASFLQKILSDYPIDKLKTGAKLPDAVREQMRTVAKQLYETRGRNYNDTVGQQYKALAAGGKVPFEYIGQDFQVAQTKPLAAPAAGSTAAPQGVDPAVWAVMTPEERALWK